MKSKSSVMMTLMKRISSARSKPSRPSSVQLLLLMAGLQPGRIPAVQSVSFDPATITRERISELLSDMDTSLLESFDNSGVVCISGFFDHWKWPGSEGEGKTLDEIAAKEAAVYYFREIGSRKTAGWEQCSF